MGNITEPGVIQTGMIQQPQQPVIQQPQQPQYNQNNSYNYSPTGYYPGGSSGYYPSGAYPSSGPSSYGSFASDAMNKAKEASAAKYGDLLKFDDDGVIAGKDEAQQVRAALVRAEWDDWVSRFLPIEKELIGSIGNPEVMNAEVDRSRLNVMQSFNRQRDTQQEFDRRYGVQRSADSQRHMTKRNDLMQIATMADAANDTRRSVADREMEILGGFGG